MFRHLSSGFCFRADSAAFTVLSELNESDVVESRSEEEVWDYRLVEKKKRSFV